MNSASRHLRAFDNLNRALVGPHPGPLRRLDPKGSSLVVFHSFFGGQNAKFDPFSAP